MCESRRLTHQGASFPSVAGRRKLPNGLTTSMHVAWPAHATLLRPPELKGSWQVSEQQQLGTLRPHPSRGRRCCAARTRRHAPKAESKSPASKTCRAERFLGRSQAQACQKPCHTLLRYLARKPPLHQACIVHFISDALVKNLNSGSSTAGRVPTFFRASIRRLHACMHTHTHRYKTNGAPLYEVA